MHYVVFLIAHAGMYLLKMLVAPAKTKMAPKHPMAGYIPSVLTVTFNKTIDKIHIISCLL